MDVLSKISLKGKQPNYKLQQHFVFTI